MLDGGLNIMKFKDFSCQGTDWTQAFLKAIDELDRKGGGILFVGSGTYPTRSIELKSNITLYLEAGAVLDYKDDYENYPLVETLYEGYECKMFMPLIFANHASRVSVMGDGYINGNGQRAWKEQKTLAYRRPNLICFQYCEDVKLEGVKLINSPSWTVHPLFCSNVSIHGISIKNPTDSPNTDGINPDGCSNVRIYDCQIDVGDDCIAIKSGTENASKKRPCENITITNCNMIHGHGGVVIGSEMSGSIRNVTVSNCIFQYTDRGIRMKTRRRRGGAIEQLLFHNIIMDHVLCPFTFNMYYCCGTTIQDKYVWEKAPYPVDEGTPVIRNIMISDIIATNVTAVAGFMYGLAEQYVENITFTNCRISMNRNGEPGMPEMLKFQEPLKAAGFLLRNAKNIVFQNVKIDNTLGEEIDRDTSVDIRIS